jgi:hypothetical protein
MLGAMVASYMDSSFIYSQMYKFHLLPSYREKNLSKYCSQSLTDEKSGAGRALKKNLCSVANTR